MPAGKATQSGFTLLALLAGLAILAFATQAVMTNLSQQAQREREAQLLEVGQTYMNAIGQYYESSPGSSKTWPSKLEDLLEDKRMVGMKRYLRQIAPDPMTRSTNWGLVTAADGGIQGIYSTSTQAPIRSAAIVLNNITLPASSEYTQWKFIYQPKQPPAPIKN